MKKYSILFLISLFLIKINAQVLYTPFKHHIDKIDTYQYASAGDLDGDGTDELVVTGNIVSGEFIFIFDVATDGSVTLLQKLQNYNGSLLAHFIDMDNDSDLDLVMPGGNKIRWYENDGTGTILPAEIELDVPFDFRGSYAQFFDFDNDGDQDLIGQNVVQSVYHYHILENINGNFVFYQDLELSDYVLYAHQPIDLDGDGDLDLISAGGSTQQVYISYNENNIFSTPKIVADIPNDYSNRRFAAGDLDGDNDIDLGFVGAPSQNVLLAYNDGTDTVFTNTEIEFSSFANGSDIHFIDIDGDADLDVFVGGWQGYNSKTGVWLQNNGGTMTLRNETSAEASNAGWAYFSPIQIDADANTELVAISGFFASNRIYTLEYDNVQDSILLLHQFEDDNNQVSKMVMADMDLDGDKDMVSFANGSKLMNWFETEFPNIDNQIHTDPTIVDIIGNDHFFQTSADLNGDGYPDIILSSGQNFTPNARTSIYFFQPATNDFSEATTLENFKFLGASIFDADGDGDLDILSDVEAGHSLYLNTDGNGNFSTGTSVLSNDPNGDPASAVIDLENDGDLDLVLYSRILSGGIFTRKVVLLENDGNGNFSTPILLYDIPSINYIMKNIEVADMNQDGLNDIILRTRFSSTPSPKYIEISVFYNLGSPFQFSEPIIIFEDYSNSVLVEPFIIEDIDLDGDLDFLYQDINLDVKWQENIDNSGLFSFHITPNPTPNFYSGFLEGLEDMDGDGDLDFIFQSTYEIYWTENSAIHKYWLEGDLTTDTTLNCAANFGELKIADWLIVAKQNQYEVVTVTDSLGKYRLPVDTGAWIVSVIPKSDFWLPCFTDSLVVMPEAGATITTDFYMQPNGECGYIDWNISDIGVMRPCQSNTTSIEICNYGVEPAEDIVLEVMLDSLLYFDTTSHTYTVDADSTIYIEVGTLEFNECETVTINAHLHCGMVTIDELKCMKFRLLPEELCTPSDSLWDGSMISVDGTCEGDSIFFTLQNIGTNAMSSPAQHRVEIINDDIVMLFQVDEFQLGIQEQLQLKYATQGMGMRLSANQTTNNPVTPEAMITVPNCDDLANNVVLNMLPTNNGNPFEEIHCKPIVTSYDPNDKIAIPTGIGLENNIQRNWGLDYTIRFQNTGNDTAFLVVLRDTISEHLDLATLSVRSGSHPFTYELNPERELKITFANILLVDSLTNPDGSQGFVEYSISPKATVPFGSVIENTASIYFDYNDPIFTNTVFHTIQKPIVSTVEHVQVCPDNNIFISDTVLIQETIYAEYDSIHFTYITISPIFEIDTLVEVETGTVYEGVLINGDTSFTKIYTTQYGCDSLVHFQFSILTNLTSPHFQHLKIFPNPVFDYLNISGNKNQESQNWQLVNATGKTIWSKSLERNEAMKTVSMEGYPVGVYWLEVKTKSGFGVWKIIKLE